MMLGKTRFFTSLRYPHFRLLWLSGVVGSLAGGQMILMSWLVLQTTDSPFLLGLVMALRFGPQALGMISGVAADRIDRRKLLIAIPLLRAAYISVLGSLILGSQIQYWHIALISFLESISDTFTAPAQTALMMDIVGGEGIVNASALQGLSYSLFGIAGPSLVGVLVNQIGIGPFFYFNAAVLALSTAPLLAMREAAEIEHPKKSVMKDLADGFRYTWTNKGTLGGQMVVLVTNLYMWPCVWTLLPIFARNALHADAAGLGWLTAANQAGGFIATLAVAHLGSIKGKGRMVLLSSAIWGGIWVLMAALGSYSLSIVCLVVSGISSTLTMTLSQIIILVNSSPEMRGRAMGIRTLTVFPQSPMSIVAGAAVPVFGIPLTIALEGALFIASMAATAKLIPALGKAD